MTETPKRLVDRSMRKRNCISAENSIKVRGEKNHFIIEGTLQQKELIEAIITNSFTQQEQTAMVKKGDLIISVQPLPLGIAGFYAGKDDGSSYKMYINNICLGDGDTVLHELIHHSRMVDESREGILLRSRSMSDMIPDIIHEDRSLEDAATTLESLARQHNYVEPFDSGYYNSESVSKGCDPLDLIRRDRELVAGSAALGSKGLKGAAARNIVDAMFNDSEIKNLIMPEFSGVSAKDRLDELRRIQDNVIYF